MPAAPNDRQVGPQRFDRARDFESIMNRPAREHGHAEAKRVVEMFLQNAQRLRFNAAIDDDRFEALGIEMRSKGEQAERHGVKHRLRIIEQDFLFRSFQNGFHKLRKGSRSCIIPTGSLALVELEEWRCSSQQFGVFS